MRGAVGAQWLKRLRRKRKPLAKLDEETREAARDEAHNEDERVYKGSFGVPLLWNLPGLPRFRKITRDRVLEPVDDADPKDEHGLPDVLREDDAPS